MPPIVQGVDLFASKTGSGPTVLFLHGNPDSADIWYDVIEQLQDRYTCVALDLPGLGRSRAPRDFDYSFENLGRFVTDATRAIGLSEPVHLVAHDFGGAFGMAWAIAEPDRVRSQVIINHPFFVGDYRWHTWARIWRTPVLGEMSMLTMNWPLFRRSLRLGSRQLSVEKMRRAYSFVTPEVKKSILRLYRAANPADFQAWESRMIETTSNIPTLVLWGEHDPYIPNWVADRFGTERVIRYPDSGHWVPAEVPEDVARDLGRFFASQAPGG